MSILKSVVAITIIGFMGSSLLYGEAPMEQGNGHGQKMKARNQNMKKIFQQLNLTQAQKKELRASRQDIRKKIKNQKSNKPKISDFITEKGVDRDGMLKVATKRTVTMTNLRADMIEKTLKILTPEQRKKFVSLLKAK